MIKSRRFGYNCSKNSELKLHKTHKTKNLGINTTDFELKDSGLLTNLLSFCSIFSASSAIEEDVSNEEGDPDDRYPDEPGLQSFVAFAKPTY